jgi:predicted nucleic acid-binding protein
VILVDASVWNDHFRRGNPIIRELLDRRLVLGHPFVRGEVSLGSMADRADVLDMLDSLPQANQADHLEVATMIEKRQWFSTGIGYVDAHLLASLILTPASNLWTSDAALRRLAGQLGRTFSAAG